jgi:EAL domain-containing protein (putative c-di-GMP-specific phosphodiesterase class I)
LLRPHPSGPDFKPFELFEVARETGLHSFLDRQARLCAIETSAAHLKRGTKRFINFLPSSIYNPNYCLSHTFQAIEDLQLDPSDLVFEVVETEKVEDTDHLKKVFKVYKEHGVNVALDDVGQGFSTLALVADLQPDYIKIDRATIDGCDRDKDKQATIGGIIKLAADFGGVVLAEGIERAEEWAFVKSAGVQLGQGYLFGKPAAHAVGF